jgi:hypothetical protein
MAVLLCATETCAQTAPVPSNNAMSVPITMLQKGDFSGIRESLQIVVRIQGEWEKLWNRHVSFQSPPAPALAINFNNEMVVGVFAGEKNTGGYEVEITGAQLKGSRLYIYYAEKKPPPAAMTIQAFTQPFHLIKLPRSDAPTVFVEGTP